MGILSYAGKPLTPPKYERLDSIVSENVLIAQNPEGYHFLDATGKQLNEIAIPYPQLKQCRWGFIPFRKDGKWGILNTSGKEVIPPAYDEIYAVSPTTFKIFVGGTEEMFLSGKENVRMGYTNLSNKVIWQPSR